MKDAQSRESAYTTAMLIDELRRADPAGTSAVTVAGVLRIARIKRRSPTSVDVETCEAVGRDPETGVITVQVLD